MKKFIFPIIIILSILCLGSCGEKYKPVKSTKEEARVVATLTLDGEKYEIKYELYRALFLNCKELVDGGDASVWSGDKSSEYVDKINEMIFERAAEIYSVLHLGGELGIDPYSKEINEAVTEYVRIGVEGNGADIEGHRSYDEYLESLKAKGMNYSVHDLLYRYSIVLEKIEEYYKGTSDQALGQLPGEFEIKRENVKAYYDSDECVRIFHLYYADGQNPYEMSIYKAGLENATDYLDAALYIINNMPHIVYSDLILDSPKNAIAGIMLGKYTLDERIYSEYISTAFYLSAGEVSDIITVTDGGKTHYIIYKLAKDNTHFDNSYEAIKNSYIDNEIGKRIDTYKAGLQSSVSLTSKYGEITHGSISMD